MTTANETFTVGVPRDFVPRFASIFKPMQPPGGIDAPPRYGCCFPASELPAGEVLQLGYSPPGGGWRGAVRVREDGPPLLCARSNVAPLVVPGEASPSDLVAWESLLWLCDQTNMPREWAFRERELRLLVEPMDFDQRGSRGASGRSLVLRAVQVVDLDEGFLRRELRRRIEEMG